MKDASWFVLHKYSNIKHFKVEYKLIWHKNDLLMYIFQIFIFKQDGFEDVWMYTCVQSNV